MIEKYQSKQLRPAELAAFRAACLVFDLLIWLSGAGHWADLRRASRVWESEDFR